MNPFQNTKLSRYLVPFFLLFQLLDGGAPVWAKSLGAYCGTYPLRAKEELLIHRQSELARAIEKQWQKVNGFAVAEEPKGRSVDRGDIAILEEDAAIVSRRNLFNLQNRTLRFLPEGNGYRVENTTTTYNPVEAEQGSPSGLDDDDTREYPLAFPFNYYGRPYASVHVNSDGNFTFGMGDGSSRERSLGRLLSGLPRIGGYFTDLDPTRAGQLNVLSTPERFVASWIAVPEYTGFGVGPRNTFQIRLLASGVIEFAFSEINTQQGVVGLGPGDLTIRSEVVSFTGIDSATVYQGAVAERFRSAEEIDIVMAAQRFFETHEDTYDYIAIYNALGISPGPGTIAFEVTVRNNRTGYGDFLVDFGREFGSPRRLQAILNMGPTNQYPVDPNTILTQRFTARDTPTTVLAHEAGHLFLAFASVPDPANPSQPAILGRQSAHWAFTFNSEASILEGNRISDRGPTTSPRFETIAVTEQFSPLDQYLMGFRAKEEVGPLFFVTGSGISSLFPPPPTVGRTFDGTRNDFTVDDLIAVHGRRTPDHTVSQRKFRMAIALIVPRGMEVSESILAQVEGYRRSFEEFYGRATGGRSTIEARLGRKLELNLWPAAGVPVAPAGSSALGRGEVRIAQPQSTELIVNLQTSAGLLEVPATVTIPAGQTSATFPLRGLATGVAGLRAFASQSGFLEGEAHIQVTPAAALQFGIVSGNNQTPAAGQLPQPVVLRVTDINRLPYPGLRIRATPAGNGQVQPAVATVGEDGTVSFRWTPAEAPANRVLFTIEGIPAEVLSAVAVTAGAPLLTSQTVVNAASFTPGLTGQTLHTIFGANLAPRTALPPFPWPTAFDGVRVRVNGEPQPLIFLSESQINFYLANELAGSAASIEVETSQGRSANVSLPVRPFSPGIFFNPANGEGAVIRNGNFLEIYATGFGPAPSGIEALWNNSPIPVTFAGLAPGFVGLNQINVQLPAGASGINQLRLRIAGTDSNEVRITLH